MLIGGFSALQWSVRSSDPGALVVVRTEPRTNTNQEASATTITITTTTIASTAAGPRTIRAGRKQSKVFDNRDLCRIISTYIPVKL